METSRDDFVIAVRSAFLQKGTKQKFSILGLIFFSILIIFLGSFNFKAINYMEVVIKEAIYRLSFIVSIPENFLKKRFIIIQNHYQLYDNYEINKNELSKLKEKNLINDFIIEENIRLKKILEEYYVEDKQIVGKVLIDKQSPFLKSVVINKGTKSNIKLGMAVLDGEYLVGKIVEVNYKSSRALLLSDLNSKIPAEIASNGVQTILSGTGKDYGIIQYSQIDQDIKEGSVVYTSGAGGLFKAGIPLGKIKNTDVENKQNVIFFSDFSQLKFIKIVSYKNESN